MTSYHDLLNLVDNVKEKLTDSEYKELADKIASMNKNNKQQLYNITFIKTFITHKTPDSVIVHNVLRNDKVYLEEENTSEHYSLLTKYNHFQYKKNTEGIKIIVEENYPTDNEDVIIFEDDENEDNVSGWVYYHKYTLVEIKKV
jgi:hypothetical protein